MIYLARHRVIPATALSADRYASPAVVIAVLELEGIEENFKRNEENDREFKLLSEEALLSSAKGNYEMYVGHKLFTKRHLNRLNRNIRLVFGLCNMHGVRHYHVATAVFCTRVVQPTVLTVHANFYNKQRVRDIVFSWQMLS